MQLLLFGTKDGTTHHRQYMLTHPNSKKEVLPPSSAPAAPLFTGISLVLPSQPCEVCVIITGKFPEGQRACEAYQNQGAWAPGAWDKSSCSHTNLFPVTPALILIHSSCFAAHHVRTSRTPRKSSPCHQQPSLHAWHKQPGKWQVQIQKLNHHQSHPLTKPSWPAQWHIQPQKTVGKWRANDKCEHKVAQWVTAQNNLAEAHPEVLQTLRATSNSHETWQKVLEISHHSPPTKQKPHRQKQWAFTLLRPTKDQKLSSNQRDENLFSADLGSSIEFQLVEGRRVSYYFFSWSRGKGDLKPFNS